MRQAASVLVLGGLLLISSTRADARQARLNESATDTAAAAQATRDPAFTFSLGALVALQALDTVSTLRAVKSFNARERNPVMAPLVKHPVAFVAVKTGVTAGTVVLTRRLYRRHPRAAKVLAVALDSAFSAIVVSNFRIGATR